MSQNPNDYGPPSKVFDADKVRREIRSKSDSADTVRQHDSKLNRLDNRESETKGGRKR